MHFSFVFVWEAADRWRLVSAWRPTCPTLAAALTSAAATATAVDRTAVDRAAAAASMSRPTSSSPCHYRHRRCRHRHHYQLRKRGFCRRRRHRSHRRSYHHCCRRHLHLRHNHLHSRLQAEAAVWTLPASALQWPFCSACAQSWPQEASGSAAALGSGKTRRSRSSLRWARPENLGEASSAGRCRPACRLSQQTGHAAAPRCEVRARHVPPPRRARVEEAPPVRPRCPLRAGRQNRAPQFNCLSVVRVIDQCRNHEAEELANLGAFWKPCT